ncbi:ABC transporter substrate-binding protein [Rhizobium oryziradicis]|uniref:Sugar ABC transporter substrate-binding protein n=1 Tax=Rhizobium oryziradicis TaxID=1867956 RepID=A0A1Q8ZK68_9HYPH|nr:sugar ABC transporter substrate-binding protein [Rhizobium oryziradicis]OLP42255.1 sugar ABC transporter substrate-binding protein [Rhizobium oryziradicis]
MSRMNFLAMTALSAGLLIAPQMASAETIKVWSRETTESIKTLEEMAAQFTKETGIKVELYKAMNDFEQRVVRAAAGHDLPDLVLNDSGQLGNLLKIGILEEVNPKDITGGDKVLPAAWKSAQSNDGKYYAVPMSAQSFGLFIRKDWLDKLGLKAPTTWQELHDVAEAFTKKDPDGNGKNDTYGFTMPASTTRGYASWFISNFLWQAGGQFVEEKNGGYVPALSSKAGAETMKFVRSMVCEGLTQPGAINATTADVNPAFRSGQTGMYLTGPYNISAYDTQPGKDKFEVVAPPSGPGGGPESLAEGTSIYFMKGSQHADAARKFAEYLISPQGQLTGMAVDNGLPPMVRLPVIDDPSLQKVRKDPRWDVFAETYAKHSHYVPAVPDWQPFRMLIADGFNKILADCNSDIPAGLKKLDADIATTLASQGVLAK